MGSLLALAHIAALPPVVRRVLARFSFSSSRRHQKPCSAAELVLDPPPPSSTLLASPNHQPTMSAPEAAQVAKADSAPPPEVPLNPTFFTAEGDLTDKVRSSRSLLSAVFPPFVS